VAYQGERESEAEAFLGCSDKILVKFCLTTNFLYVLQFRKKCEIKKVNEREKEIKKENKE